MRIKTRVRTAMSAQAATQGRFLGGRPPYGYRLADAGPHPNPEKAGDGKRLHQLEPDPETAPVVQRIFDEYLAGRGLPRHRRAAHRRRDRLPERRTTGPATATGTGSRWGKSAVRAILRNPRYTGYQVWAKQRREEVLLDVEDVSAGHQTVHAVERRGAVGLVGRAGPRGAHLDGDLPTRRRPGWRRAAAVSRPTARRRRPSGRYLLRGRLTCGLCQRKLQGSCVTRTRRTTGASSAPSTPLGRSSSTRSRLPPRGDLLPHLDDWLATALRPGATSTRPARRSPRRCELEAGSTRSSGRQRRPCATATRKLDSLPSSPRGRHRRRRRRRLDQAGDRRPQRGHGAASLPRGSRRPQRSPPTRSAPSSTASAGCCRCSQVSDPKLEGALLRGGRAVRHLRPATPESVDVEVRVHVYESCRRGDLNPHVPEDTSPSSWRVCQFRHSDVAPRVAPGEWSPYTEAPATGQPIAVSR